MTKKKVPVVDTRETWRDLVKWKSAESKMMEETKKSSTDTHDEEETLEVTPELVMKVTGAKKPLKVPQRRPAFEDNEDEDGDPLDFMDIMRRLLVRGQNEGIGGGGGGPASSIFSRVREQVP